MKPFNSLFIHWESVRPGLLETINKFSEAELDFVPFPGAWTVRQLSLHIGQEEHGEFAFGIAQTLAEFPPEYPAAEHPTRASILARLAAVHAPALDYLQELDEAGLEQMVTAPWGAQASLRQMFQHMIDHEIHHRGELSLILGLLGKKGLDA